MLGSNTDERSMFSMQLYGRLVCLAPAHIVESPQGRVRSERWSRDVSELIPKLVVYQSSNEDSKYGGHKLWYAWPRRIGSAPH